MRVGAVLLSEGEPAKLTKFADVATSECVDLNLLTLLVESKESDRTRPDKNSDWSVRWYEGHPGKVIASHPSHVPFLVAVSR